MPLVEIFLDSHPIRSADDARRNSARLKLEDCKRRGSLYTLSFFAEEFGRYGSDGVVVVSAKPEGFTDIIGHTFNPHYDTQFQEYCARDRHYHTVMQQLMSEMKDIYEIEVAACVWDETLAEKHELFREPAYVIDRPYRSPLLLDLTDETALLFGGPEGDYSPERLKETMRNGKDRFGNEVGKGYWRVTTSFPDTHPSYEELLELRDECQCRILVSHDPKSAPFETRLLWQVATTMHRAALARWERIPAAYWGQRAQQGISCSCCYSSGRPLDDCPTCGGSGRYTPTPEYCRAHFRPSEPKLARMSKTESDRREEAKRRGFDLTVPPIPESQAMCYLKVDPLLCALAT